MRIGVNLLPLIPGRVGGIKQHAVGLLDDLLEFTSDLEFVLFVTDSGKALFRSDHPRIRVVVPPKNSNEIEERYKDGEYGVLFAPLADPGITKAICPLVSLIVDLQHRTFPDFFSNQEITFRRLFWEWPARAAQTVCVSTDFVAGQLSDHLRISRDNIILTPPPLLRIFSEPITDEINKRYYLKIRTLLPDKFLLYPANTWPHKNHQRLLQALAVARKDFPDIHLVLTGWAHKVHQTIVLTIEQLGLENSVTWLGYVPDNLMPLLYQDAAGLVFPSLFEGFGIPILEAMHSGCPITCSNVTSLPEVAQQAALYFDPGDINEMANCIKRIWTDELLRNRLIQHGLRRASEFSREATAMKLYKALHAAPMKFNNLLCQTTILTFGLNLPKVSIIIPSFMQAQFLGMAIDSVLQQQYPNLECIVIDGGSTDGSVEILKKYGNAISWISEHDNGQAHAINKGLRMCRGEIIGWLNSDDLYRHDAVLRAVQALSGKSGCWLIYGEATYINANGRKIGRYPTDTFSHKNLLRHCCICQPTVFFTRSLYELGGGLDESFHMAMDYELWLRYAKITPFLFLPEELASSRLHTETKTSKYRMRSIKESMMACRRHFGRTSIPWCIQYAQALAEKLPILKHYPKLRKPIQAILLVFVLLYNEGPYIFRLFARRLKNLFFQPT